MIIITLFFFSIFLFGLYLLIKFTVFYPRGIGLWILRRCYKCEKITFALWGYIEDIGHIGIGYLCQKCYAWREIEKDKEYQKALKELNKEYPGLRDGIDTY